MEPRSLVILALLIAGAVLVLYLLYRSPPPMRTADHKQIERETAEIQGDTYPWWKRALEAVGWVLACLLIAGLVVPK